MIRGLTGRSIVTLVELPNTEFGRLLLPGKNGRVSHNVYSNFKLPGKSVHTLEGVLRANGCEDVQSIIPAYHGENGKLSQANIERLVSSDLVLLSAITSTAPQTLSLVRLLRERNPDMIIGVGGHDPTFRPQDWIDAGVDFVGIGEGENTLRELYNALTSGKDIDSVSGILYRTKEGQKFTGFRKTMDSNELVSQPLPYYDKKTRLMARTDTLETSRGCIWNCNFCSVRNFYGQKKYIPKTVERVVQEYLDTQNIGRSIFWSADNSFANMAYGIAVFNAIADMGVLKDGIIQATPDIARNPEALKVLHRAAVRSICLGVESFTKGGRDFLGKPYSPEDVINWLDILCKEDFANHLMMMPGGDNDNIDTMKYDLDLAIKYGTTAQFFPPGPLPGTELRELMVSQGRLLRPEHQEHWNLYDGHYVLTRHPSILPFNEQMAINQMYGDFYSEAKSQEVRNSSLSPAAKLIYSAVEKGVKHVLKSEQMQDHLEFLKSVS